MKAARAEQRVRCQGRPSPRGEVAQGGAESEPRRGLLGDGGAERSELAEARSTGPASPAVQARTELRDRVQMPLEPATAAGSRGQLDRWRRDAEVDCGWQRRVAEEQCARCSS